MSISTIKEVTPALEAAFQKLIPQLSSSSKPLDRAGLERLLEQKSLDLLIYQDAEAGADGPILGMLSLVTFEIPTGWRAWIEDVVVDDEARGHGIGQKLVEAAIELAQQKGVKSIDLTSRPTREAANRLYKRCGFALRETNVYRYAGK
ncbi:N-acetyltransferase [uncultured Arcanobacterium sp.]|uniref:GNAT family N-acetyltransferase n=1 Tax=uncultured Arcanobacterium sp. TaxID=487520 RepID=UPI0026255714|nr:GNAT family N-acetyltransferase [uncultured Arcanobacterium sp.]